MRKRNISDYDSQLARDIDKTINEIYPEGIDPEAPEYFEYPGIKKLSELINTNIVDAKNYKKIWGSFNNKIRKATKRDVHGTTYGFVPGFSGELIMERFEDESLTRIKKISYAVSLIGPYFSICGIDETFIKDKAEPRKAYHAINVVTTSPYAEFADEFNHIQNSILATFPRYKFVPFRLCISYLKNTKIYHTYREDYTVYNALFNHLFDYYQPMGIFRGDGFYGFEKSNTKVILMAPGSTDPE